MTIEKQLEKLSAGNQSAFEYIYAKTYKTVYYVAMSILRERELSEDVMQATYLSVIKNAGTFTRGTNAVAWIARIARNEALNVKKKRGREIYVDERETPQVFGTGDVDDYGLLTDLARRILDEDEFLILMLISTQGYRRAEIAQMFEMPVSTVTYKFNRAIEKMRKALDEK